MREEADYYRAKAIFFLVLFVLSVGSLLLYNHPRVRAISFLVLFVLSVGSLLLCDYHPVVQGVAKKWPIIPTVSMSLAVASFLLALLFAFASKPW